MSSTEIIYGTNPVIEVLRAGRRRCHEVIVASGRKEVAVRLLQEEALRCGTKVNFFSREKISALVHTDKHQGVAARVDSYPYADLEVILEVSLKDERKGFIVILDGITDPQNLGALVRTANLMGVHGLILPTDKAASVSPTVVKASAGATEYQLIAQVTNIANTIGYIKDKGFWVAGAAGESEDSVYLHDFKGYNIALVLGAEGRGIRRLVREKLDYLLSIPMQGKIDSYNVSIAGALFMGEVARQRWFSKCKKTA